MQTRVLGEHREGTLSQSTNSNSISWQERNLFTLHFKSVFNLFLFLQHVLALYLAVSSLHSCEGGRKRGITSTDRRGRQGAGQINGVAQLVNGRESANACVLCTWVKSPGEIMVRCTQYFEHGARKKRGVIGYVTAVFHWLQRKLASEETYTL